MNITRFQRLLSYAFHDVRLGAARTLLDEDYADTSVGHKYPDQYGRGEEKRALDVVLPGWSDESKRLVEAAVCSKKRIIEPYSSWRDIPQQYLMDHYCGVNFFSPEAFRYYLPAFMQNYILHWKEVSDHSGFESWMRVFDETGGGVPGLEEVCFRRFSILSLAQARVVAIFLNYVRYNINESFEIIKLADAAYTGFWFPYSRRYKHGRQT